MKNIILLFVSSFLAFINAFPQVAINSNGDPPVSSAMLEVTSSSKGLLLPRLTSVQRNGITAPVAGLMIYNTDTKTLNVYDGTTWQLLSSAYCGNPFTDARDGKTYNTILIGSQCWMQENLNVGIRIDGIQDQANNSTIEKYCYDNLEINCNVFGGLYQWGELMNYTASSNSNPSGVLGLCPIGWHIPSDVEWCQLLTYLDASVTCDYVNGLVGTDIGGKLKEAGNVHWTSPNVGASNLSGFTALPAGGLSPYGKYFYELGSGAHFFSSTQSSLTHEWENILYGGTAQLYHGYTGINGYGCSVRCVKD